MAQALQKADVHSVVVFDFIGPDKKLNTLGQELAAKFNATLQKSNSKLSILDRAAVKEVMVANRVAPGVIREPEIAWWLATQMKADAFILGELSLEGDQLKIDIGSVKVKTGGSIVAFSVVTPISEEMRERLAIPVGTKYVDTRDVSADKGKLPTCLHCPPPQFSQAAVDKHIEGTVLLTAVVGLDGRARDIEILKPLSHRLTEKAIVAVQSWTFAPGKSADGQPLEVETPIEVSFRLGR
jgi:TonB family protein